jgi:Icc-related predicted phosphoesterase
MSQTSTNTRFLVISDTHDTWPYTDSSPPAADVLLHCGDLTQVGGLASFKRAMEHIKSMTVEKKLIIAGNHDLELDSAWVRKIAEEDGLDLEEALQEHRLCVEYMKRLQKKFWIYYLEEGEHEIILESGVKFSIYASPYTPEFNDYAFAYKADEDRFNSDPNSSDPDPIPAGVDIVMTHGPPLLQEKGYRLDCDKEGKHLGCDKLMEAVQRAKPRLHCFGHVHEGRGAARVIWDDKTRDVKSLEEVPVQEPVSLAHQGAESLFLNAAINEKNDKGFVVGIELGHWEHALRRRYG